jgi:hypothetical protein
MERNLPKEVAATAKPDYRKGARFLAYCIAGLVVFAYLLHKSSIVPDSVMMAMTLSGLVWLAFKYCQGLHRKWLREFGSGINSESAYAVLGLHAKATDEEIELAYQALVEQYDPDLLPDAERARATALLKRINCAFALIGNEDVRLRYDALVANYHPSVPPLDEAFEFISQKLKSAHSWASELESETENNGKPTGQGEKS